MILGILCFYFSLFHTPPCAFFTFKLHKIVPNREKHHILTNILYPGVLDFNLHQLFQFFWLCAIVSTIISSIFVLLSFNVKSHCYGISFLWNSGYLFSNLQYRLLQFLPTYIRW